MFLPPDKAEEFTHQDDSELAEIRRKLARFRTDYMATISTHLNWGASYVVDDVYRCFIRPDASEQHYVNVGRGVTVALMLLACLVALWLRNAMQAFQILLQIRAGTGLIFLLRWY